MHQGLRILLALVRADQPSVFLERSILGLLCSSDDT